MFRINKEKSDEPSFDEGRIVFSSYHNRLMIVVIALMLIVFLAITGYLMIGSASSAISGIIPYVTIFILIFLIVFALSTVRLPLTIAIEGDVLTVEKLFSRRSFNRAQISAFEVQTENMPRSRSVPMWRHTLILRTYEHGSISLATQPSLMHEAIEYKEALRILNKWRTS